MKNNQNQITKIVGFYVDDWHLTAMLLPHIHRTLQKGTKVLTILENGIYNNIKELLSKMNLNDETNNKILEINWTSAPICKYQKIKEEILQKAKEVDNIQIIVKGTDEYIEIANENIEKVTKEISGKEISIINCYETKEYKEIDNILDKHDRIINTSGIKQIEEIFTEYKKKEKNIQINKIG